MIPDEDIKAIREHSAKIEEYEARYEARRQELMAPYRDRAASIWNEMHDTGLARLSMRQPSASDMAEIVWSDPEIVEEMRVWREVASQGLNLFARENRPDLQPWDTPGKLVDWIGRELEAAFLRERIGYPSLGEPPKVDPVRTAYRSAHARAMSFVPMAASILSTLPEAMDPMIGLQRILGLFRFLDTPGREPNDGWFMCSRAKILRAYGLHDQDREYGRDRKDILCALELDGKLKMEETGSGEPNRYYFTDLATRHSVREFLRNDGER